MSFVNDTQCSSKVNVIQLGFRSTLKFGGSKTVRAHSHQQLAYNAWALLFAMQELCDAV